jgi:predicted DNA-binding protein
MLSVRLTEVLQRQLDAYCDALQLTKSSVVQEAIEKHLAAALAVTKKSKKKSHLSALRGTGNKKFTTDEIMRMTRGDDWCKR